MTTLPPPKINLSRIELVKADIDRFSNNPDYSSVWFPKGDNNFDYLIKLLILLFRKKDHCFRTLFYKRIGKLSFPIKWLFRPKYNTFRIGCPDIEGGGIYMSHPYGTTLNCEHIGYGCSFMQNTTFGAKPHKGKLGRPYLESYVKVGANAVVIGDVHIGNHVTIGAGAVVTKSIPDNCVVVGNPARIIFKDGVRVELPL